MIDILLPLRTDHPFAEITDFALQLAAITCGIQTHLEYKDSGDTCSLGRDPGPRLHLGRFHLDPSSNNHWLRVRGVDVSETDGRTARLQYYSRYGDPEFYRAVALLMRRLTNARFPDPP